MSENQAIKIEINFKLPSLKRFNKAIKFVRSHRRLRLSLLLLLLAVFYGGVYEGISVAQAERLIRKGEGFNEEGMYQEALTTFQEADLFWRNTLLVHRVTVSPTTWRMNGSANEVSLLELSHLYYEKGIKLFKNKKWKSAVSLLSRVVSNDPDYADAQKKITNANDRIAAAKEGKVAGASTKVVYRTIVKEAPPPLPDTKTQQKISDLEEKIAELATPTEPPQPDNFTLSLTQSEIEAVVLIWCYDPDTWELLPYTGSGTIYDPNGYIYTNKHVVEQVDGSVASTLCAVFVTNDPSQLPELKYFAAIYAYSLSTDVADLTIYWDADLNPLSGSTQFPYIKIGSSTSLKIGDALWVAGYPDYGSLTLTLTEGIVSGFVGNDIKTDAQISNGNSGGAALNSEKELIGIPTYRKPGGGGSLGYIIEIDQVQSLTDWITP